MDPSSHDVDSVPPPQEPFHGELPDTHFRREDDRWSLGNQLRDWLILLVMIIVYLVWTGIVYFFEPGIR